jgi:hypothetical protein
MVNFAVAVGGRAPNNGNCVAGQLSISRAQEGVLSSVPGVGVDGPVWLVSVVASPPGP